MDSSWAVLTIKLAIAGGLCAVALIGAAAYCFGSGRYLAGFLLGGPVILVVLLAVGGWVWGRITEKY